MTYVPAQRMACVTIIAARILVPQVSESGDVGECLSLINNFHFPINSGSDCTDCGSLNIMYFPEKEDEGQNDDYYNDESIVFVNVEVNESFGKEQKLFKIFIYVILLTNISTLYL